MSKTTIGFLKKRIAFLRSSLRSMDDADRAEAVKQIQELEEAIKRIKRGDYSAGRDVI